MNSNLRTVFAGTAPAAFRFWQLLLEILKFLLFVDVPSKNMGVP